MERIEYIPYNLNIAKECWHNILMSAIEKKPIYTDQNKKVYYDIIKYIHADKSCPYELKKGLIIAGSVGSGKTKLFEVINEYMNIDNVMFLRDDYHISMQFKMFNALKIVADYAKNGHEALEKYVLYNCICIDDMGTELTQVSHYGNKINCIEQIIERRYLDEKFTHISTNLNMDQIRELYGERVYSRLNEMCNYITLVGEDFRK